MNERIKEIAEQAHEYVASSNARDLRKVFEKKFAELIIRECAQVASDYDGAHYVGTAIETHFGIR